MGLGTARAVLVFPVPVPLRFPHEMGGPAGLGISSKHDKFGGSATATAMAEAGFWPPNRQVRQAATANDDDDISRDLALSDG